MEARDWPDFNALHSLIFWQIIDDVWGQYANTDADPETRQDWLRSVKWIANSWLDARWHVGSLFRKHGFNKDTPIEKVLEVLAEAESDWDAGNIGCSHASPDEVEECEEYISILQGLMSGERGTGFHNGMCNKIYTRVASRYAQQYSLKHEKEKKHHSSGDDAVLVWRNLLDAIANVVGAYATGQVFKPMAQLLEQRQTEFLRIRDCDLGACGYAGRLLGSAVLHDVNKPSDVGVTDISKARARTAEELIRKHYSPAAARAIVRSTCSYWRKPIGPDGKRLDISSALFCGKAAAGGVSHLMETTLLPCLQEKKVAKTSVTPRVNKRNIANMPDALATSYVNTILEQCPVSSANAILPLKRTMIASTHESLVGSKLPKASRMFSVREAAQVAKVKATGVKEQMEQLHRKVKKISARSSSSRHVSRDALTNEFSAQQRTCARMQYQKQVAEGDAINGYCNIVAAGDSDIWLYAPAGWRKLEDVTVIAALPEFCFDQIELRRSRC